MVCFLIALCFMLTLGCGAGVPVTEPLDFSVAFPAQDAPETELVSAPIPVIPDSGGEEPEKGEISVSFGIVFEASSSDSLADMVSRAGVTVIDFTADWCEPCQHLKPEIEKLAAEYEAVCFWSVDINRCPSLRQEAGGVASVPCVKIYSGESEVGQVVGNYPARLRGLLLSVLKERSELWEF